MRTLKKIEHTCACGKSFMGISRAQYCPDCRYARHLKSTREGKAALKNHTHVICRQAILAEFVGFERSMNLDWEDEDFALAMKGRLMGICSIRQMADDGGLPIGMKVRYRNSVMIMRENGLVKDC
jgi:hypothetical protein